MVKAKRPETPKKSPSKRRISIFSIISAKDVTEESMKIWLGLPANIRKDPSLVSFQMEHDRLHGNGSQSLELNSADEIETIELRDTVVTSTHENGPIEIHVTDENGLEYNLDDISGSSKPQRDISVSNLSTSSHLSQNPSEQISNPWHRNSKLIFFLLAWIVSTGFMTTHSEKTLQHKLISIDDLNIRNYELPKLPYSDRINVILEGAFLREPFNNGTKHFLSVELQTTKVFPVNGRKFVSYHSMGIYQPLWKIPIANSTEIDDTSSIVRRHQFNIDQNVYEKQQNLRLQFRKNTFQGFTVRLGYDPTPVDMHVGIIYAAIILLMFYILLVYEIVHRTFAAVFASVVAMGILSAFSDRPTMKNVIDWMDTETLLLLFSMMILVAVLTETGVFNYIAVYIFKITNGRIWPLIYALCITTAVVSAILDNVTTILLMTPVTIKLCECLELNPTPVLMAIILNVNIGATATPLGHIPNLMITGNHYIAKHGVTFLSYTLHMLIGVVLLLIQTCLYFHWQYGDIHELRLKEPKEIKEMRREITVWERTAASLTSYTKDSDLVRNTLLKKVKLLKGKLKKKEFEETISTETYNTTLDELKQSYPIKNVTLLIQAGSVLIFIITLFFVQSIPSFQKMPLSWCALIGVLLLLIIAEKDDMDAMMHRIEWTTLLFFAAMFVTMECLARLGLVTWIGEQTKNIMLSVENESTRLAVGIVIILWVSAVTSSLVDCTPVTAMMIKVVVSLAENEALKVPIQPLVWAVAFGPCLGGNGTLYGASANVICAGIAEQHGYKITFGEYFKKCFPIMIINVLSITGYLLIAHIFFQWHDDFK